MDYQLKGLILNCTLKSYAITPIESANVLKVTMRFYGHCKYNSPSKWRRNRLLAKFRKDPVLVPVPFLEPGQSPHPLSLSGPVLAAMEVSLLKQVHEIDEQIRGFVRGKTDLPRRQSKLRRSRKRLTTGLGTSWTRGLA